MTTKQPPQIPNYRILEKLGEGGMASVWLAQRDLDHRISVIKVLHEHLTNDQVVRSRFLREGQVASLLSHPNVARLYDAGLAGGASYLAMEFIAGQEVEAMMMKLAGQKQMLPPELSITMTLRVLEGLHYAHEFKDADGKHLEIVHRDLSPRNVMVTFDGEVKIIDFGLVRTNLGDFRTAPGMIAGTLRYMSPEQATADRIDRRSDIYTWCVVLYELLTGRPLVAATEARTILGAVVVDVPPPLSARNASLPKSLDGVLAKALEKDPENRFQTALELRDALALAAGALGTASRSAIGEFVTNLFPAEKLKTSQRLESAETHPSEGPAFESTRLAASEELSSPTAVALEPTVTDRLRPSFIPRSRSKLPWVLSAAAIAICLAALAVSRPEPVPETEAITEPPPTVVDRVTVRPVPVEQAETKQAISRAKLRAKRSTAAQPIGVPREPPPHAPEVANPPDEADAVKRFNRDAEMRLGAKRGKELYTDCGLAMAVLLQNEDEIRRKLIECREQLKSQSP